MKTTSLIKVRTMLLMLFVSTAVFLGSCSKDDKTVEGDKTALNTTIVTADALSASATIADYPQADITAYKATLATVKTAAATSLTQLQVDNLDIQLKAAIATLKSKEYGFIDESLYLVAGWHFDEGTGATATSYATAKQVATFTKGWTVLLGASAALPTWVDGVKGGKAIYLNNGAHLEVPYSPSFLPADISISAWIKNDVLGWENNCIVSQNYWWGYKFATQGAGKPLFTERISATSVQDYDAAAGVVAPNVWTHVAVTLNSTTKMLKFYINGIMVQSYSSTDGVGPLTRTLALTDSGTGYNFTPQPFLIGSFATDAEIALHPLSFDWISTANVASFKGTIDELKVYNTVLVDGQVGKLYNDEKP